MGYGFPAAIGAAFAAPDRQIICVSGDGSFQMNLQELMTAVDYQLPVKVAIMNNGYLGMVRQWQQLFFHHRYSSVSCPHPIMSYLPSPMVRQVLVHKRSKEAKQIIHMALNTLDQLSWNLMLLRRRTYIPSSPGGSNNEMIIPE